MSTSGDRRPILPPPTVIPNANPRTILNGANSATGIPNSSSARGFPATSIPQSPSPPIIPTGKASTAQQLLPRIQESLAAHGAVCPSLSSGRVHPSTVRSPSDQVIAIVNPAFFNGNPNVLGVHQVRGFAASYAPAVAATASVVDPASACKTRSPLPPQRPLVPVRAVPVHAGVPGPPRIGAPAINTKVNSFSAVSFTPDLNNYKDMRDQNGDNAATVVINDRKVRILDDDSTSLYALCRSWVRNDMVQDIQPPTGDDLKLLPRPLPSTTMGNTTPIKQHEEAGTEELSGKNQVEGSVEDLSTSELLGMHIKHAKRVRARLREERLHRIDRFKQRLALLLPPSLEQNKQDLGVGN